MILQPVVSNVADFFHWKIPTVTIPSNDPAANANRRVAQFQVQADSFFCLMAWRGVTNYDQVAGEFITQDTAVALYGPAKVPNNFEVMIKRNSIYNLSPIPIPQGVLCSYGYGAGAQLPWPILYSPLTRFDFEFYNTAAVLLTAADQETAIDLRIDFSLFGYNIPAANIGPFLQAWPALSSVFKQAGTLKEALAYLSAQDFSNIVPGINAAG